MNSATAIAMDHRATPASDRRPPGLAFVEGQFVPAAEARVPLLDWGFIRSDACQDTVSVADGWLFRLDDHLRRFRNSCDLLRMQVPYDDGQIKAILIELVGRSGLQDAYVQMLMTRGVPAAGSRDPRSCLNRFLAFCLPYVWIAPLDGPGLRLHVSARPRISSSSVPSEIKNYHWIDFELALFDAYDRGCDTAVLVDDRGMIAGGPGFNIFCLTQGRLRTPARNILAGITRETVIELAKQEGLACEIGDIAPDELLSADEVFATSTAGGVMPITAVEGTSLGTGAVGSVTSALREVYWRKRREGWHGTGIAPLPSQTVDLAQPAAASAV